MHGRTDRSARCQSRADRYKRPYRVEPPLCRADDAHLGDPGWPGDRHDDPPLRAFHARWLRDGRAVRLLVGTMPWNAAFAPRSDVAVERQCDALWIRDRCGCAASRQMGATRAMNSVTIFWFSPFECLRLQPRHGVVRLAVPNQTFSKFRSNCSPLCACASLRGHDFVGCGHGRSATAGRVPFRCCLR